MIRPSHRGHRFVSPLIFLLLFSPVFRSASGHAVVPQKRPDPLNHFTDYASGYDVRNKHYWASAAFTGVHGYLMAGAWLLFGICFGISFVLIKNAVAASENVSSPLHLYGNIHYLLLFLACLLTLLVALVGTTMVIVANRNFVEKTKRLRNTIEAAGNDVARAIRSSINAMTRIQYLLLPYDPTTSRHLNITNHKLGKESKSVQYFVRESRRAIDTSLHVASVSHVVVATLNFIFLLAALVLIFLHWSPGFIAIIISCWILTALFCVLTGFDFFLHTFADDTCSALDDYVRDPYNNSLSALLPCMNRTAADNALKGVSSIIHNFITQLNQKITEVTEELASQGKATGNLRICDPFSGPPSYKYEPQDCPNDTLPVGQVPKVRKCTRGRNHDWTDCPFLHPGEKARRRDPRRFPYCATACTDFRCGSCTRGDDCEFAHGVFECWLHPTRYRTEACKDGESCTRKMLAKFTCKDHMTPEVCEKRGKFIPEYAFLRASAYSNAVQEILNLFPDLQSLTHCRMVNAALFDVVFQECRPFTVSTRLLWESMFSLSICMMVCVLTWLIRFRQEKGRSFSRWSVYPTERTQDNERVGEIQVVQQPIQ